MGYSKDKRLDGSDRILDFPEEDNKAFAYGEGLKRDALNSGIIYLFGPIEDGLANLVSMELRHVIRNTKAKKVLIDINSPGGAVYSAYSVYENIKMAQEAGKKVVCSVNGLAASAACMIVLQAADVRLATKTSRFLFHEPRRWSFGVETTSNARDEAKELESITTMIYNTMAERSGKSVEEIASLVERRELWMSPEEALKNNLIDAIAGKK